MTLYSRGGDFLQWSAYDSTRHRYEVLSTWGTLYGMGFNSCYMEIRPNTWKMNVRENGMNASGAHSFNHENKEAWQE